MYLKMRHILRDKYIFKQMSKYFLSIDSITLTSHLCRNKNDFERASTWLASLIVSDINFPQAINTICLSPGKHDGHTPPPRVFVIPPMPSCTQTSCTQTSASCFSNCYNFIVSQNCLPPYIQPLSVFLRVQGLKNRNN